MNLSAVGFGDGGGGDGTGEKKKKKKKKKQDGSCNSSGGSSSLPSVSGASGNGRSLLGGGAGQMPSIGGGGGGQYNKVDLDNINEDVYDDDDYEGEDSGDYVSSAPSSSTVATAHNSTQQQQQGQPSAYVPNLIDEAGSGENAGAISDWGFALEDDAASKRSAQSHLAEDDLVSMNSGTSAQSEKRRKKKHRKEKENRQYEEVRRNYCHTHTTLRYPLPITRSATCTTSL